MKRLIVFSIVFLTSCANARAPMPIALKQASDKTATCEEFASEYEYNTTLAGQQIQANNADDANELLYGAQLIWGRYDVQNANGTEGNALLDRNAYIQELAAAKDCNVSGWPEQPERYK